MRTFYSFLFVFVFNCVASGQFFTNVTLPVDEKFSSDVQVEYTKGQVPRSYVVGKIRGVEYRYFHDNSQGIIEGTKGYGTDSVLGPIETKNWRLSCHGVGNSGQKDCVFSKEGIAIITYKTDKRAGTWIANTSLSTGDQNIVFADSFRVDDVEIYDLGNKQFSADALSLMRSGKLLTLHRGPKPDDVMTYSLYGFAEALELCEWAIKHIQ